MSLQPVVYLYRCAHGAFAMPKACPACAGEGAEAIVYFAEDAVDALLRDVSRDFAGAHVNAGEVVGAARRRIWEAAHA